MLILPMFVLRRLDCLLEATKDAVIEEVRFQREEAGFITQLSVLLSPILTSLALPFLEVSTLYPSLFRNNHRF